jgi:hypothetical protein
MYLPEQVRDAVIARIVAKATTQASFYRQPIEAYDSYPAFILEYADNDNMWSATKSDKKVFMFNLYIAYDHDNTEASRAEAEANISNALGELYTDVFANPDSLNLDENDAWLPEVDRIQNSWVRASQTSWGYGSNPDIPIRMAMLQLEVTVHQDRQ